MNDKIHVKLGRPKGTTKPADQRRTEVLKIMLTPAEYFSFAERVKQEQAKNMSALARKILEL